MRLISTLAVAAGLAALAACNQSPREERADNIEAAAENEADMIVENAENTAENIEATAENQADAVEDTGTANNTY